MTSFSSKKSATISPTQARTDLVKVVGVGSSAGGLEALQLLLRGLRSGLGVAYVVAQHVSPQHRSVMAELLDRETTLAVEVAADGQRLEPDHVYVTPPNADVTVVGDRVCLSTPLAGHGPKPSIDGLFLSLASSWGTAAVAVLLSGTGDDGTYGMREVHACGGLTIAQEPTTAKYDAMPSAAIQAGVTDVVLGPMEMGEVITSSVRRTREAEPEFPASFLQRVVEQLRHSGGGDFSQYKTGTLLRQVARRMAVLQLDEQADYLTYLSANATEARLLRQSILVSVTSFLRDPQAWDALGEILRRRWATIEPSQQMRVWVPGCATGEEAVTLAMVVDEVLGQPPNLASRLKIFATDLDEVSLDYARRGTYPSKAIADLPAHWQQRYFVPRAAGVEVASHVRDAIIFARHDIASDPAFVRLDLVSFRNVLIYFDNSLQNHVLRALHYALRPDGLLFLGNSEGLAGMQDWFAPLSKKFRLFERVAGRAVTPGLGASDLPAPARLARSHPPRDDRSSAIREALLRLMAPTAVVVNDADRVTEILGDVSGYLLLPTGKFDDSLAALLRDDLRVEVRGLVVQARASARPAATVITTRGHAVTVKALPLVTAGGPFVALIFDQAELGEEPEADDDGTVERLRNELSGTREALQATIEELETSNEELQATNEEMTAAAEELQASNEELETINEELQATNEELGSLNQELQVRQHELTLANEDLQNIQDALAHAIIIVDGDLRITRFSPLAVRVFALVDSDVGRILTNIPATVPTQHLEAVIREVIGSGKRSMVELVGERQSHLVHVVPYRGSDGRVKGAILSITDVTESAWAARGEDEELMLLRAMTEGLDEVVWRREADGQLTFINRACLDLFGVTPDQALTDPVALDQAVVETDLAAIGSLSNPQRGGYLRYGVRVGGRIQELEDVVHSVIERPNGERTVIGSIRRVATSGSQPTEPDLALSALLSLTEQLTLVLDRSLEIVAAGRASAELLGISSEDLIGRGFLGLVHEQDAGAVQRALVHASESPSAGTGRALRVRLIPRGGMVRWVELSAAPIAKGSADHVVVMIADVTEQRDRALDLGRRALVDSGTGLLNRASFIDALRIELSRQDAREGRTGLLWIDLDGFKEVNDRHGHSAGDVVLREVAERLQGACRRHDRVGRLGGDEFGVIVTDAEYVSVIEAVASAIIDTTSYPIEIGDSTVTVGASIGISLAPQDSDAAEELLNAADTAMYEAKRGGGGRFHYYTKGLNEQAAHRAALRQELAEAIRNRDFVMVYQPIISLSDDSVWGVEALVRWRKNGALVAAADFVPTAEQTGQIRLIGRQVVQMVLEDLPPLVKLIPNATVCMNMSVGELEDQATMKTILHEITNAHARQLCVEVTENALVTEDSAALSSIAALTQRGIGISLDDFGTGFANFAALDRLAPHVIKADRSFSDRAVAGSTRASSLLTAVVALAEAIGSKPLAEGLSTADHLTAAREAGVELGQGYHLGMPMPLSELAMYLKSRQSVHA